jgi:hypothetical protein
MAALIWVEVLDRRGHVRARQRIDALPATIGRGYGCDVLLDDPWASPIHARVYRDLDGSFKVEDAGSENGLWAGARDERVTLGAIGRGITLRAGRTHFRLVPADAPVARTLAMHVAAPAEAGWDRWWVGVGSAVAAGLAFATTKLVGDPETHHAATMVADALSMMTILALWAGIWALVTRAVWHRARFLAHYAVAALTMLALEAVWKGVEFAAFIAPGVPAFEATLVLLSLVVVAAMLAGHLSLATALDRRRVIAISSAIVLGFAGLAGLIAEQDKGRESAMPEFSSELAPLDARLIPTQDTTAFFAGLPELKAAVDSLVTEPEE